MGIVFKEEQKLFRLTAGQSEYVIGLADDRYVGHVYFGRRIEDDGCGYLMRTGEMPYVPSINKRETGAFMDFRGKAGAFGTSCHLLYGAGRRSDSGACM